MKNNLKKIESIFSNYALKIPITNNCKLKATELAEGKKAPFGTKNSIGDAYIFLSLIEYISANNLTNCVFITNNYTDFSLSDKDRDKIHPDLEPDFNRLGIAYYVNLKRFFYDFSNELPNYSEYKKLRIDKDEDRKLSFTILNPQTLNNLTGLRDSYIENTNQLDFIFNIKSPTKQQVLFTLDLLESDDSYKRYFYEKIDKVFWFQILKERGDFLPSENPSPIEFKNEFQIPYWGALLYLERISTQIKNGEIDDINLIHEMVNIIKTVSEEPRDNYKTWYLFIKILSNLPNKNIPIEILDFIPIWLDGKFKARLQSAEICERLLPKFLNEHPTSDDIKKAETVIKYLLSLEKGMFFYEMYSTSIQGSYQSRVEMYYLKHTFTNQLILERVTKYCSSNIIIELANNIKKLRFDFPNGLNIKIKTDTGEFNIETEISENNLLVSITQNNELEKSIIDTIKILNYEQLNKKDTLSFYSAFLKKNNIHYTEDEYSNIFFIVNTLFTGSYHAFSSDPISKLDNDDYYDERPIQVFSLIFRDLLNQLSKTNSEKALTLLRIFAFNGEYRLPFFQKIILYVIGENWISFKGLFLELISENDPKRLFSEYHYKKDLYELLDKNQRQISQIELNVIQNILNIGFQGDSNKEYDKEYWKFRWYSALRTIPPYTEFYSLLSKKYGETHEDILQEGEVQVTIGDRSPMTTEEILEMTNDDIVNYIHSFKPKDRWQEPTISGFSDMLGKAIGIEPLSFSEEIEKYHNVYYIYAYHIANGFREAWKNKCSFNWEKVLLFFYSYIKDKRFYSGQFALENDGWDATSNWVVGEIAGLLTGGMQSDDNAFDKELLPIAKDILFILVKNLISVDDIEETNMDYPTYSLNSTAGKVLRAWLDYALRIGRNNFSKESDIKWDDETKDMFESACQKGIIDTYILTGLYFQQFYFLDKDWICSKVKQYYNIEEKYWLSFMGGFIFGNPISNKTIYILFYPHYERIINNNINIKNLFQRGIIRHIVAFYLWGFEDLKNGVLSLIINKGNHGHILELVNFIWRQEKNIISLKNKEKVISDLWVLLAHKYENPITEEEQKVLVSLSNLLALASELNEFYTNLVLKSMKIPDNDSHTHFLIENLLKKKNKGEPNNTAKYIGIILNSIQFTSYISSTDEKHMIELVEFLYKNGQKISANDFWNKMTRKGHEFLKDIYNQN